MTRLPTIVTVLAWAIAMPAMAADPAPQPQPQSQPGAEVQSAAAPVSPLAAQPFDRLSATRDRPLFSPTRHPPAPPPEIAVEPAPPPPPSPPPNIVLLAVVMDGEEARAIVRTAPEAKILRVQIGDDIAGWKVGQIEARRLVLSLDERSATFTMFTGNSANSQLNTDAAAQSSGGPPENLVQQAPRLPNTVGSPSNTTAPPNTETPQGKRPHRHR